MRSSRLSRSKVAQELHVEAVADKRTEEEEEEPAKGGGPLYRLRRVRLPAERAQKQGGPANQHRRARKHHCRSARSAAALAQSEQDPDARPHCRCPLLRFLDRNVRTPLRGLMADDFASHCR